MHRPPLHLIDRLRQRVDLDAQARRRLVDQVDRLVRQEAVGDVTVRQGGRGDQGGVLDPHAVVDFVAFLESTQDRDGVLHARLLHHDRLETALEGRVFFDVLAVLFQGRRADATKLPTGESRLQHVRGVNRSFGGSGADEGVQLVDEQDVPSLRALDLAQQGLQSILELAAVLAAGDEGAQVERDDLLPLQSLRDIAVDDPAGQPLDDGGLADARLADQHRIVLGAAGQHLHDATDLFVPADDRIELAATGHLGQVPGIFLQSLEGVLGILGGDALAAAHRLESLEDLRSGDPRLAERVGGPAGRFNQREEAMLDRDKVVVKSVGAPLGALENSPQPVADARRGAPLDPRRRAERFTHPAAQALDVDAYPVQEDWDKPALLIQEGMQKVLGRDFRMPMVDSRCLGRLEGFLGFDREPFEIHRLSTCQLL